MQDLRKIRNIDGFSTKVVDIFNTWQKAALLKYPRVSILYEPKDVVRDVEESLLLAIKAVRSKKEFEDFYGNEDYCVGFILGYLAGHLSQNWSFRYLPLSGDYDEFLWLLSLEQILPLTNDFFKSLNNLYTYYKQSEVLLNNKISKKPIPQEALNTYHILAEINMEANKDIYLSVLKKSKSKAVERILKNMKRVEFSIGNIISYREIINLLA